MYKAKFLSFEFTFNKKIIGLLGWYLLFGLALKLFFIFKHLDKLILETFLQAILGSTELPHFRGQARDISSYV